MKSYKIKDIPQELIEASELIAEEKLKKAEPILRTYLKKNPLDINAMKLLADIGVKFRAYKDAGYLLTRALDLAPDYDQARLSYANLLYKRQLPFEALKNIEILLENDKDNAQYLTLKAVNLALANQHHEAQNITLALNAMNYSSIWRTGKLAFNKDVQKELDLKDNQEILGYLYVGTEVGKKKKVPEHDLNEFISYL